MWNEPTRERLAKTPKLYETEDIPAKEKLIHLHFFIGGCDWYICETDGEDIMFGFCILNNDYDMAEWGYVSLSELRSIKVGGWCEVDCEREEFWKVKKAIEIDKIHVSQGWLLEDGTQRKCSKEEELKMKIEAKHFKDFQDLFAEVTSPYSDFFGIDPYPIWEAYNEHDRNLGIGKPDIP